jgi:prepilin-type N-terminal cleavage/methylation domain-containing protein
VDRKSSEYNCRGLTLIELMITLVILGVTVTAATPAMQQLIHGSQLRTVTSRLLDAVNLARSEAVIRNIPVSLCPSNMAMSGQAGCSGRYIDGWIVFNDRNRDGVLDAPDEQIIRAFEGVPPGYTVSNLAGTRAADELITYLPDGSSRRNRSLLVCPPRNYGLEPWSVVLNTVGRARLGKGNGQCPVGPL